MENCFYFYANPYQAHSVDAAMALAARLTASGAKVYADSFLARRGLGEEADAAKLPSGIRAMAAFGGDGTLLRLAPHAARQNVPLLGIHTGTVGFLMRGDAAAPDLTAKLLLQPVYRETACPMLDVAFEGARYLALNDLSLTRGEHPGVMEVRAEADGEQVFCCHGDGVVVSTPMGATAYALAAGGPIVHPDTPCLLLTPLSVRELLLRPVVLPLTARLTLFAHGSERRRLQLAVDGQTLLPIVKEAKVEIGKASERLRLIAPEAPRFFDTLRKKQAIWNGQEE